MMKTNLYIIQWWKQISLDLSYLCTVELVIENSFYLSATLFLWTANVCMLVVIMLIVVFLRLIVSSLSIIPFCAVDVHSTPFFSIRNRQCNIKMSFSIWRLYPWYILFYGVVRKLSFLKKLILILMFDLFLNCCLLINDQ